MTIPDAEPPGTERDERADALRRQVLSMPFTAHDFRPASATVKVDVAAGTHRGASRTSNEDHYLVVRLARSQETLATSLSPAEVPAPFEESGYGMLVADGLGEGGTGSVASRVALSMMAQLGLEQGRWNLRVDPTIAMEIIDRAQEFYARTDAEVYARSLTGPILSGISTSLTAAYSAGDALFVAHVGHSRAYLFREGTLTLLTRDSTMAQDLSTSKGPVPVERRAQDLQHILTDAVGANASAPKVSVEQFRLEDGDIVLLCTNGLSDVIDDAGIAEVLARRRQPSEQCAALTDLARERSTEDDVTVVLAQYRIPRS